MASPASFSFQTSWRHEEGVPLLGPPGLTSCLQWDFSDLEAGRLAECQQIRSPESVNSAAGSRGLMPSQGAAGQPHCRVSKPHCLVPTLPVGTQPPRGGPGWAQVGLGATCTRTGSRAAIEPGCRGRPARGNRIPCHGNLRSDCC